MKGAIYHPEDWEVKKKMKTRRITTEKYKLESTSANENLTAFKLMSPEGMEEGSFCIPSKNVKEFVSKSWNGDLLIRSEHLETIMKATGEE